MIRRHRRVLPATIVAVVLLAAAVLVAVSCVQLLLDQQPLLPFATLAQTGAAVSWNSIAVLVVGGLVTLVGLILLAAAWSPGAPTVLALASDGQHSDAGATRRGLARTLSAAAGRVDGVTNATTTVGPRRVRATVSTGLRDSSGLAEQVREAVGEQLSTIALARTPRVSVRVNRRSS